MNVRYYTRKRMWTKEIFNIESPFLPRKASSGAQAFRVPSEKSVKQTNENEKSVRRRSEAISPFTSVGARLERDRNRNGECTVTHNFKLENSARQTQKHGTGEAAKKKQVSFHASFVSLPWHHRLRELCWSVWENSAVAVWVDGEKLLTCRFKHSRSLLPLVNIVMMLGEWKDENCIIVSSELSLLSWDKRSPKWTSKPVAVLGVKSRDVLTSLVINVKRR